MTTSLSKYKFVILGDKSTGKTCIINRFISDTFNDQEKPTLGADFSGKTLCFENIEIRL